MIYSIFYLKNSNYQVLLSELSELIRNHNWIEFKFFSSISQFSPWYWTLPKAKSRAKTEINFLSIQTDHISQKMKKTKNVKPQTKHPYLKIKPKQPWVVHFIQFNQNNQKNNEYRQKKIKPKPPWVYELYILYNLSIMVFFHKKVRCTNIVNFIGWKLRIFV